MNQNGFSWVNKFVEHAGAVNLSESGGPWCDDSCHMKIDPETGEAGRCYAMGLESHRPNVLQSGIDRRLKWGPVLLLNKAAVLARYTSNYWFRFATAGSMPSREQAREHPGFETAFKNCVKSMVDSNADIHLPVETSAKRRYYQKLCDKVRPGRVRVRESVHTIQALFRRPAGTARSHVVGFDGDGLSIAERKAECKIIARRLRDRGESVVDCPAIVPRTAEFKGKQKRKCGECKACAVVDVVLYALN